MSIFRRDTGGAAKAPEPTPEQQEILEFPFEVLWQDEEPSTLLTWLLPGIQIVLLIVLIFMVKGIK